MNGLYEVAGQDVHLPSVRNPRRVRSGLDALYTRDRLNLHTRSKRPTAVMAVKYYTSYVYAGKIREDLRTCGPSLQYEVGERSVGKQIRILKSV